MKAAVLYGKEQVRVEEIDPGTLKSGEVRVRIESALTCGTDLKVYKRGYHAKMIVPPAVFGHELAGTICELGPNVDGWKIGDHVVAANSAPCGQCAHCQQSQENLCDDLQFLNGAYAESIIIPERLVKKNLLKLKPGTTFEDAALVEPLACVVLGMEHTHIRAGHRLLVIGAGPIGLMFVALAANSGCEVTVAGRGETRLRTARNLGAKEVLDVTGVKDVPAAVGRRDFDVVIEAVGHPKVWEAAVQLVRKGGTVNFFGGCPANSTVTLDTGLLHYSNLFLLASFHHTPATIRRALKYIEDGVVCARDFVSGECNLEQLPQLFASMASGNRAVKTLVKMR